ncbi:RNA-binding protein [Pyxidicoccus sp. MSG2]|uniref:RNA-binding protein n=1 Tax=Pyxidicoccus sp. MSG2 TaxID=2996790 RepID=UPI002271D60C|nr:RNA-binding protein [Pyxidicoccus sp. MSG2]MCY1015461.1 RNA-binding protein [Pyxidicoccus sp. MSG2]
MKKLVGVVATVALFGSGAAFAQDTTSPQQDSSMQQDSTTQSDPAIGGSGSTKSEPAMGGAGTGGTMGGQNAMGQKELTGKVVKADSKTIFVDLHGAVVPLKVDKSTQFNDPSLKKAKDLQPGQEIRASYEVKETENVAKSISMSGTGGSGDMMSPDSSINEGTGGSGMEKDKDVDMNTGGSGVEATPPSENLDNDHGSTMNPDTNPK